MPILISLCLAASCVVSPRWAAPAKPADLGSQSASSWWRSGEVAPIGPDEDPPDEDPPDEDPPDEDAPDEDLPDEDVPDEDLPDEDAPDEDPPDQDPPDEDDAAEVDAPEDDAAEVDTAEDDTAEDDAAADDAADTQRSDRKTPPGVSMGAAARVADRAPVELFPPADAPKTWRVGAFIDVAYGFSNNLPNNRLFRGQLTTPRTGEFTLNNATAFVDHAATDEQPWIFEVALQAGGAVDAVVGPEPVPGGDDGAFAGAEVFKHVGRANAGVRLRSGTTLRGGLMGSPLGIGGTWTKDNWNYTTTWAANAAPYYLMGAMVEQSLPGDFAVQAWVVNGWQTIADVNRAPSYLVAVVRNHDRWNFTSQVYFGPEGNDLAPKGWRVHWDTMAGYAGPRWGIAGVVDFGQERRTELPGQPQHLWLLAAGFVHGEVWQNESTVLDIAARPEIMWDRDGLLFGVRQIMVGETVTLSARMWDHVLLRLEYRYDRTTASNGFFYRQGATADTDALARQQHTIFAGLVGYFERMLGRRRNRASRAKTKRAAKAFLPSRPCGGDPGSRRGPSGAGCGGSLASRSFSPSPR